MLLRESIYRESIHSSTHVDQKFLHPLSGRSQKSPRRANFELFFGRFKGQPFSKFLDNEKKKYAFVEICLKKTSNICKKHLERQVFAAVFLLLKFCCFLPGELAGRTGSWPCCEGKSQVPRPSFGASHSWDPVMLMNCIELS